MKIRIVPLLRPQGPIEEGQASIHPIIDAGVGIVELFIGMLDALLMKTLGQDSRSILDMVLVAPTAIDIDPLQ